MMGTEHVIKSFPRCGVGNKLLYYWNLRQYAHSCGDDWNMVVDPDIDSLIDVPYSTVLGMPKSHNELPFCLGENFFKYTENRLPIAEIFIKRHPHCGVSAHDNFNTCSIHLRGGDFRFWKNGEGMLSLEYYWDALNHISSISKKRLNIRVITDDQTHPHLMPLFNLMDDANMNYGMENHPDKIHHSDIVQDWYNLATSDYIISSPSTFAITAGMISDAYITHSKAWVDKRVSENDPFWVGLNNGGNSEYKAIMI